MSNVPKRHQKRLGREVIKVLHADTLDGAKRNLKAFRLQFFKQFPEAVECLERGFDDATTYFSFPEAHHVRIRTTNGLERLHGEIKRRTRVVGSPWGSSSRGNSSGLLAGSEAPNRPHEANRR